MELPQIIPGKRCALRHFRTGDEAGIAAQANDYAVYQGVSENFPHPYTFDDAASWVQKSAANPAYHWAITVDDKPVGVVGGSFKEGDAGPLLEIGYWLGNHFWGRGIGTEAVGLFTQFASRYFAPEGFVAKVFVWNKASARVLEKNGFTFDKRLHKHLTKDGVRVDVLLFVRRA